MVNKIESVKIEGKEYNTEALTAQTMAEFVIDVNKGLAVEKVIKKYGAGEVNG